MQTELFHESIDDAYRDGIGQCGGFKKVGARLWPEKAPDEAGRMLRACIDSGRNEKLSEEQRQFLLSLFREHGFHGLMHKLCDDAGYERPAIAPTKTADQLLAEQMEFHVREFRRLADERAASQ